MITSKLPALSGLTLPAYSRRFLALCAAPPVLGLLLVGRMAHTLGPGYSALYGGIDAISAPMDRCWAMRLLRALRAVSAQRCINATYSARSVGVITGGDCIMGGMAFRPLRDAMRRCLARRLVQLAPAQL